MKRILLFLGVCFFLFLGLTYWSLSVGPAEVRISEIVGPEGLSEVRGKANESIKVIPTNQYQANTIKRFMQGENYRRVWSSPVTAAVFYLDSFKILEEGGGNQTHSLKIKSEDGVLLSLRSVNKDPSPLVPEIAEVLQLENIVIDGVSAQHPYGALLAAELAEAAGILHTNPRLVFLPEQQALGKYSAKYANRLYLLEHETEGSVNWTPYDNILRIVETDKLQEMKIQFKDRLRIDLPLLVRARLFDILIGDWDRHAKQWGWVLQQREKGIYAIPLPGDRDNAFFQIDGVLPTMITNKLVQPMVRPFEKDIDHLPGFVYPIDHYFLGAVPEAVFLEQARILQSRLTEQVLNEAIRKWPDEAEALDGEEILKILEQRKKDLPHYALKFAREIQRGKHLQVPLKGSEDLDLPEHHLRCFECLPD